MPTPWAPTSAGCPGFPAIALPILSPLSPALAPAPVSLYSSPSLAAAPSPSPEQLISLSVSQRKQKPKKLGFRSDLPHLPSSLVRPFLPPEVRVPASVLELSICQSPGSCLCHSCALIPPTLSVHTCGLLFASAFRSSLHCSAPPHPGPPTCGCCSCLISLWLPWRRSWIFYSVSVSFAASPSRPHAKCRSAL